MRAVSRGVRIALLISAWCMAAVVTHLPPSRVPKETLVNDKVIHASMFCVLGVLAMWQLASDSLQARMRAACGWFAVLTAYALVDETTQPLVGRTFDWADLAADALGALIGLSAMVLILRTSTAGPQSEGGDTDAVR